MTEFLQNRATLATNMAQLVKASGAPDAQTQALFEQQNAALLKRQSQLAQTIGQQQASALLPTLPPLQIPPDASPQMRAYLAARDQFIRDDIALRNQHLNDDPATQATAQQQWTQQKAASLQQLRQLTQAASPQQTPTAVPMPPPLQMPPNASPQVQAFLTARDQLMRDQIAFRNQHLNDDPATREAAEQRWLQQKAASLQQLRQLAQALPQSN